MLMAEASLSGSISWQLSGRKCVKLATSNCGRLQGPATGAAYWCWVTAPAASLMSPIFVMSGSAACSFAKVSEAASLTERVTTFEARMSAWYRANRSGS